MLSTFKTAENFGDIFKFKPDMFVSIPVLLRINDSSLFIAALLFIICGRRNTTPRYKATPNENKIPNAVFKNFFI